MSVKEKSLGEKVEKIEETMCLRSSSSTQRQWYQILRDSNNNTQLKENQLFLLEQNVLSLLALLKVQDSIHCTEQGCYIKLTVILAIFMGNEIWENFLSSS